MGLGGQRHAPAALPPGKTRYPLYRRLYDPQGRSGLVRRISPHTGIRTRTVQYVASRYNDWAIATSSRKVISMKYFECVFVAFVIQHEMPVRRIAICVLPRSAGFFQIIS